MADEPGFLDRARQRVSDAASAVAETASQAASATANAATQAAMSKEQEIIVNKMGLKPSEGRYLDKELSSGQNKALNTIFGDMEKEMANSAKYDNFLRALGQRFHSEADRNDLDVSKKTIVDEIGADIQKDPALGARLKTALRNNPDMLAQQIGGYKQGELKTVLDRMEAPAAPVNSAARTQAAPQPVAAAAAAPAATKPKPVQSASPAAAAALAPTSTAPAPAPAPAVTSVPTDPGAAQGGSSPQTPSAAKSYSAKDILTDLSTMSDEKIRNTLDGDTVKGLGAGLGKYVKDNFPELETDATGFENKINSDPALRQRIADNLKQNPAFVRDMSKQMLENDGKEMSPMMRSAVKGFLVGAPNEKGVHEPGFLTNPELLASKPYTDGLAQKMKGGGDMGNLLGGIGSWMQNNLGIDFKGVMGSIGNFFKGIFQWIGSFFGTFSKGSFLAMGQANPGEGMWSKLSRSMDMANHDVETKAGDLRQASVLSRDGTDAKISDGYKYDAQGKRVQEPSGKLDQQGQPIMRDTYDAKQDDAITVKTINGSEHKVYLTNGLSPTRNIDAKGNYTNTYQWRLVNEVDPQGRPVDRGVYQLDAQQSQILYDKIREAAARNGKQLDVDDPVSQTTKPTPQLSNPNRTTLYVIPKNGAVIPEPTPAQSFPVPPQSPMDVRPLNQTLEPKGPAANDADFAMRQGA